MIDLIDPAHHEISCLIKACGDPVLQHKTDCHVKDHNCKKTIDSFRSQTSGRIKPHEEQAEQKAVLETDTEELKAYEMDSTKISSFLAIAKKYRNADALTTPMIYAFIEKILVHAPEKIDGERHMQIDIYLKFIGNFQVPQDEPTAEEMAEEEKQKQRRAKNREKVARCMERKKLKDAQEKEDAAHENDSTV